MILSTATQNILANMEEANSERVFSTEEAELLFGGNEPAAYTSLDEGQKLQVLLAMTIDDLVRILTQNALMEQELQSANRKLALYGNRETRRSR